MSPQRPPKRQLRPLALVNARLIDPASKHDEMGGLLVEDGVIRDLGPRISRGQVSEDAEVIDCGGHVLAPGLVDMRVQLREPGAEHMESIESGGQAVGRDAAGELQQQLPQPLMDADFPFQPRAVVYHKGGGRPSAIGLWTPSSLKPNA